MSLYQIVLPRMGESVEEAILISYNFNVGDIVSEDDTIADVATDKVDTEIPSPVAGTIKELPYQKDDIIKVGQVIAIVETAKNHGDNPATNPTRSDDRAPDNTVTTEPKQQHIESKTSIKTENEVFLSPLVKTIISQEKLNIDEISKITGTGLNNRITKRDVLKYIKNNKATAHPPTINPDHNANKPNTEIKNTTDTTIQMDRMRKLIADHMVMSKKVSPHVSTFLEVDVTNIVEWRKNIKEQYQNKYNQRLTYTPIFFHLISQAINDFPLINSTIDGENIIIKKDVNLGMAAALPSGNLIVPVIKNADHKNLIGLTEEINYLTQKARENRLDPSDIKDGTFTISNIGTFGNDAGTPIINQPQAAIIALGAINKKPAVVETHIGDIIAIRQRMILSISFDHRIIDGYYGGSFLRKIGDYFENFDINTKI